MSATGEEAVVLTASCQDGSTMQFGSQKAEGFLKHQSSLAQDFLSYCHGKVYTIVYIFCLYSHIPILRSLNIDTIPLLRSSVYAPNQLFSRYTFWSVKIFLSFIRVVLLAEIYHSLISELYVVFCIKTLFFFTKFKV